MPEQITLDPPEVTTGRTQLDLMAGAISVSFDGIDWGDAEVSQYLADQEVGSTPIDSRVPSREITLPLRLQTRGTATLAAARTALQQKVGLIRREGGALKRVTSGGGTIYADLTNATLKLPGSWMQANREAEPDASLVLQALPDFYGNEIQLGDHVETAGTELVFTETGIKGDLANRVRIVVDNDQNVDQLGLMWTVRCQNYDSAATAKLFYEAEALTPLDTAARASLAGASGGTVVTHSSLSTGWTPVLGTNLQAGNFLTHAGNYRLKARVYSTSGTLVQARAVYDVGDLTSPAENDPVRLVGNGFLGYYYIIDLGEIRLRKMPVGSHRWQGQIQARGDAGGENISIDKVWFESTDEGSGVLTGAVSASPGLSPFVARDEFNQTAGNLATPKALTVGGNWSEAGPAGNLVVETAGHTVQRTATLDANRHFGIAGTTNYTGIVVQVDLMTSALNANDAQGIVARYTDTSNFIAIGVGGGPANGLLTVQRNSVAAGAGFAGYQTVKRENGAWYTLTALLTAGGLIAVWFRPQGAALSSVEPLVTADTVAATGGDRATGKVGFFDWNNSAAAATRSYDNFAAWVPNADAAMFANRSAQITTMGNVRQDATGAAYGPIAGDDGDLLRLPPGGLDGRTLEVMLKPSRGDFDRAPDAAIGDDISAQVFYRPCWLQAPDA